VNTGASAELVHAGQRIPIDIKGVVRGSVRPGADSLSITVDLGHEAIGLAVIGDLIVTKG
jgi:hypothetical protein